MSCGPPRCNSDRADPPEPQTATKPSVRTRTTMIHSCDPAGLLQSTKSQNAKNAKKTHEEMKNPPPRIDPRKYENQKINKNMQTVVLALSLFFLYFGGCPIRKKGPFRTKIATVLESEYFGTAVVFSLSIPFSCLFSLEEKCLAFLSPLRKRLPNLLPVPNLLSVVF